jgi:hypothetical protein
MRRLEMSVAPLHEPQIRTVNALNSTFDLTVFEDAV